jgi:2'-5' RNA ligase
LGYPKENKEYVPHLTLARIKYPQKNTPDISSFLNAEYEPIKLQTNKIHFMRSELFFKGSVYTILDTHYLK